MSKRRVAENLDSKKESLENQSLEQKAKKEEETFDKIANEAKKKFNEEADKVEKKYVIQFLIIVLVMILATTYGAWLSSWIKTDGFTDYYRPFDEIKSIVAQSIEEPFDISIVFTNTSEGSITLDFGEDDKDTTIYLENVKWDLKNKKIYIKESVAESLIEKYEVERNQ